MGWGKRLDDISTMPSKLSLIATLLAVAGLALAPSAFAVGLGAQRAVSKPAQAAQAPNTPIAPPSSCPGQTDLGAPLDEQEEAMRCMTDYARVHFGLPPLAEAEQLSLSAAGKSGDILACNSFSHSACGREFTYWMKESGYLSAPCWRAGENLAWGIGEEGSVRSIFRAWMRSPGHRQNVLGNFDQIGIALRVGELEGQGGTRVWTQHFGSRC
jgi:uncharacterized protein YkwD